MQTQISVFQFQDNQNVRVEIQNGEPWFCLKDVTDILAIKVASPERFNLKENGVTKIRLPSGGQNRELTFINEPNLYRVIFRSNKAEAVKFQDWIFEDVIPKIRKTGSYTVSDNPKKLSNKTKTAKLGCLTIEQQDEIKKFHRELVQSAPKNKQAELAIGLWSAIRTKFGVTYKDVPEVHYPEVLSLMARVALEKGALSGEVLDKPKTLTCPDPALLHNTLAAAVEYFRDYSKLLQVLDKLPLTDSRMAFNAFNNIQEVCENIMKIATDWGLKNELGEPIFEPRRINFYNGAAVAW